jgi:tetratricopeptide (TPR) repeat protein
VGDQGLREKSEEKARSIMDGLFKERTARENRELEQKADGLYTAALENKRRGEMDQALEKLEEIILRYPAPALSGKVLDEIVRINGLKNTQAGSRDRAGLNAKALEAMNRAKAAYDSGSYSEAIAGYEEVVRTYRESDYTDDALAQIMRINEEMRKLKFAPSFTLKTGEVKTGVLVQLLPENSILVSMGAEEGVKQGDVLQLFRKEAAGAASYIGSAKVLEVNPESSKCKIVYFDRALKVGDIVSY